MSSTIPNRPSQTVTDLRARFDSDALAVIRRAAGHVVERVVTGGQIDPGPILGALADEPIHGIYVTLKRGHTLRGCCGLQGPAVPLQTALIDAASRTATQDPRMPPIAPVELPYLNLAVSILGPPFPIGAAGDDRIAAVHVGRHGLRIRSGNQVGLLLPSVAVERNWDARQFLDAVCHKAGLPPGTWRRDDVQLELFDGVDQDGPLLAHNPTSTEESSRYGDVAKFDKQQIDRIVHWVRHNLAAFQCGATPLYYATDVDDATVQGVVLRIQHDPQQPPANWMQLTLRDGIPLQSTLYQITQTAIETLAGAGHPNDWQIDVAILSTIVHHGSDAEYDLQGIDSNTRGIIATDGRHWGFGYDRQADLESTRTRTMQMQRFRRGMTQIYSAVCDTSADELSIGIGPRADSVIRMRPPGVAGTFYPADDQTREEMVDQLIEGLEQQARRPVHAAMVPHAGLRFSGRIAAEVWSRIALPDTVLIIGPKHTADGVDWAVAPHDQWFLSPTAQMKGNVELAQRIADRVPGMELDAAAHAREHGIEVQLPLLYRMAPETQITAIAMSAGDFEELEQAAEHLANCLAELEQPPLLIISSDMNHFADDQENRRRDRLALDAMATLDARKLLDVCSRENISMCGQIPAALVMLTLQKLNQPLSYQEIAYGTSADTTGDRSRVVGYAGVLL